MPRLDSVTVLVVISNALVISTFIMIAGNVSVSAQLNGNTSSTTTLNFTKTLAG